MEALRQVFYEIDNSNQKSVNFEAGLGCHFFHFLRSKWPPILMIGRVCNFFVFPPQKLRWRLFLAGYDRGNLHWWIGQLYGSNGHFDRWHQAWNLWICSDLVKLAWWLADTPNITLQNTTPNCPKHSSWPWRVLLGSFWLGSCFEDFFCIQDLVHASGRWQEWQDRSRWVCFRLHAATWAGKESAASKDELWE